MKKASTYLISVILTLLLIFSIIGTFGLLLVKLRALSAGNCLQLVQSQELPERVHQSLEKYYTEQENTSGIPLSAYADSISTAATDTIIRATITNAFSYLNGNADSLGIEPDFSELKADMTAFFEDYAEKNGYEKDEKYQQTLQKAIDNAQKYITSECDVFRFGTLHEAGMIDKVKPFIPWVGYGLIGCCVLDIVLLVLLIVVNRKEKETVWYWLGSAVLVSSVLVLVPTVWLSATRWFDKFAVKTDQIFAAVTGYLYGITHAAAVISGIGIVVAFCFYIISMIQHRKRNARTNGR